MHPEYRFSEVAESLKNGFLADEIVLVVARTEKGHALEERDRAVLGRAAQILDAAMKGHGWVDNPRLSSETRALASLFGTAVSALPRVYTSEAFLEQIARLRDTALQMSKGEVPEEKERIRLLRTFFFNAAQSELDRTEQLLRGEGGSEFLEWIAFSE